MINDGDQNIAFIHANLCITDCCYCKRYAIIHLALWLAIHWVHSSCRLSIHLFDSFVYSLIYYSINWFIFVFDYSYINWFNLVFIDSLLFLWIHSCINFHSYIQSFMLLFIGSFFCLLVYSSNRFILPFIDSFFY